MMPIMFCSLSTPICPKEDNPMKHASPDSKKITSPVKAAVVIWEGGGRANDVHPTRIGYGKDRSRAVHTKEDPSTEPLEGEATVTEWTEAHNDKPGSRIIMVSSGFGQRIMPTSHGTTCMAA